MPEPKNAIAEAVAGDASGKLAGAIEEVARAARALLEGRLSRDAVAILIHSETGVSKRVVLEVLETAAHLDERFVRRKP